MSAKLLARTLIFIAWIAACYVAVYRKDLASTIPPLYGLCLGACLLGAGIACLFIVGLCGWLWHKAFDD